MKKLSLPNVTVCAAAPYPTLDLRAIEISRSMVDFADAVLVTAHHVKNPSCRVEYIDLTDFTWLNWYSQFSLTEMINHVHTDFVLRIEADGYVIDPDAWNPEFLEYDYIGARWPWITDGHDVGNGGFSLRSKNLLEILSRMNYTRPPDQDDIFICRDARDHLESLGIKFAPARIADQFSYERRVPDKSTFGFHGIWNLPHHVDVDEMVFMADQFPEYVVKKPDYLELIEKYEKRGKVSVANILKSRL